MPRILFASGILVLALSLAACEDPSNVGINLVEQGGEPEIVHLAPTTFQNVPLQDVTGNATIVQRPIAGRVDDPELGTIEAFGDVDFIIPSGVTEAFRNGNVTSARLKLVPIYIYGDTTAIVTLALRDFPEEWESTGAIADTVFTSSSEIITQFSFTPTDSLLYVDLPQTWLSAVDSTLRSTLFNSTFHGLQLEPVAGNAIVGFSPSQIRLEVVSANDTTSYTVSKTFTHTTRTSATQIFSDRLVLRDGAGPGIDVQFDFSTILNDRAVNNIQFRFPADTLALSESAPPNFSRPQLREIALFGITDDNQSVELDRAVFSSEGVFVFDTVNLIDVVQNMLLNNSIFTRFRLGVPPQRNSVNAVLIYQPTDGPSNPEAVITVTPIPN